MGPLVYCKTSQEFLKSRDLGVSLPVWIQNQIWAKGSMRVEFLGNSGCYSISIILFLNALNLRTSNRRQTWRLYLHPIFRDQGVLLSFYFLCVLIYLGYYHTIVAGMWTKYSKVLRGACVMVHSWVLFVISILIARNLYILNTWERGFIMKDKSSCWQLSNPNLSLFSTVKVSNSQSFVGFQWRGLRLTLPS